MSILFQQSWGKEKRNLLTTEGKPGSLNLLSATSPQEALTTQAHKCPKALEPAGPSPASRPLHWRSPFFTELPPPMASCSSFQMVLRHHLLRAGTGLSQAAASPFRISERCSHLNDTLIHSPYGNVSPHLRPPDCSFSGERPSSILTLTTQHRTWHRTGARVIILH